MKRYPHPYLLPTEKQAALVAPLAERLLTPVPSGPAGELGLPVIAETDPAFKALKEKPYPLVMGMQIETRPLATIIGLVPPAEIAARFGSFEGVVKAGQSLVNGAALLYGLSTAAIRFAEPRAAEALIAGVNSMKFGFSYGQWLVDVVDPPRMDALLLEQTTNWRGDRNFTLWSLLEYHRTWSPQLSGRVMDIVKEAIDSPRHGLWRCGVNGYAENLHESMLVDALALILPVVKTHTTAKRWATKIKKRLKGPAGGAR